MAQFIPDANGRHHIVVRNDDGSSIDVYEQGANLVSWKGLYERELLYLSPKAVYANRVPLRGGVPLIFPQYSNHGPLAPAHGFARLRRWKIEHINNGEAVFSLRVPLDDLTLGQVSLSDNDKNAVALEYTIRFSLQELNMRIKITNMSDEASASFHFAFHTYFAVNDVQDTLVNGVNLSPYVDVAKTKDSGNKKIQPSELMWKVKGEVDRIYPNQTCAIMLQEVKKPFIEHISAVNLPDAAVWNPGPQKCANISDLPAEGYKNFVCVEHGAIMKRVTVSPSSSWSGSQVVRLLASNNEKSKL